MSTDYKALELRAIACPRWRWMGGMRVIRPPRHDGATGYTIRLEQDGYRAAQSEIPDLTDPATVGCLLALVREQYQDATTQIDSGKWWVAAMNGTRVGMGRFEAEALVAALEAAP